MGEMVERVARALFDAGDVPGDWSDLGDGPADQHYRVLYREMARAVIKAMREPTEEMRVGFDSDGLYNGAFHDLAEFRQSWALAIDAALQYE